MFQSSRMASGILPRQTSSACSPSSASAISNSSPSRIRRATLRMTLESSTTRQVFIASFFLATMSPLPLTVRFSLPVCSRRFGVSTDIEYPVHIEHDQEIAIEAMHARRYPRQPGVEIDGIALAARGRQPHHLADRVDQEAVGLALALDPDRHARLALLRRRQAEAQAHVDRRDDAAAQIEHAGELGRGERHARE